jgi:hypothetical protein
MFSRKPDFRLALLTLLMAMAPCTADAQLSSGLAFLLDRDCLRFEIRFDATEDVVSSRVLALAKTVHGKK